MPESLQNKMQIKNILYLLIFFSFFELLLFPLRFFRHKLNQQVVKKRWMETHLLKSPLSLEVSNFHWTMIGYQNSCDVTKSCSHVHVKLTLLSDESENKPLMSNLAHTSFCTVKRSNRKQNTFLSFRGDFCFLFPALCVAVKMQERKKKV